MHCKHRKVIDDKMKVKWEKVELFLVGNRGWFEWLELLSSILAVARQRNVIFGYRGQKKYSCL